jgi:alkylation response protein AidB-like acyl-CoA dehydrogenase
MMLGALDVERSVFSALPVGIGRAALDASLAYAARREQFGRPIGEFQLVQEMLARMATEISAARLLVYQAAAALSGGERATKEASYAKLFGAEMVNRVTQDAVQIFGGYGYIREFPVERYLRDARLISLGGGTSEIQKLIIARELLKGFDR